MGPRTLGGLSCFSTGFLQKESSPGHTTCMVLMYPLSKRLHPQSPPTHSLCRAECSPWQQPTCLVQSRSSS